MPSWLVMGKWTEKTEKKNKYINAATLSDKADSEKKEKPRNFRFKSERDDRPYVLQQ